MKKRQPASSSSDPSSEKRLQKDKKSKSTQQRKANDRRLSGRGSDRRLSGRGSDRRLSGKDSDRKSRKPQNPLRSDDLKQKAKLIEEESDFSLPILPDKKVEAGQTADIAKRRLKELEEALRYGAQRDTELQGMRINRYLAFCGLGSRRMVEKLVEDRRVQVNGKILEDLGYRVQPSDLILVDGRMVRPPDSFVYIALNKPPGYVVSRKSYPGNPAIYELLPPEYANLGYAGRLDRESRGLVILSSDGAFLQSIAHPRQAVLKRYIVTVDASIDDADLQIMTGRGVKHQGEILRAISARVINRKEKRVEMILAEGRNRQIRRMFEALEYQVVDLQRVSVGRLSLEEHPVPEGDFFPFSPDELLSGEKGTGKAEEDVLKGFRP
jgi:23S rRNA pseudouridine2605 synthase